MQKRSSKSWDTLRKEMLWFVHKNGNKSFFKIKSAPKGIVTFRPLRKVTFQYVYISAQRKRENESRFSMFYLEKKEEKLDHYLMY